MNTPEIKQKAQTRIEELVKKKDSLSNKYQETKESHEFASGMYGSELCVSGMLREESDQLAEIEKIITQINLLKKVINDEFDLSRINELNLQLGHIEAQITPLRLEQSKIRSECSVLVGISNLLR